MSEICVRNGTGLSLDRVQVLTPDAARTPVELGPLPVGATSPWRDWPTVQRYPSVEAAGEGTDLVHLPFAGAAQAALAEGRWTYVLRLESGRFVVDLEGGPAD